MVIAGNTFTKNAGYIDSHVIFIRARGNTAQDVYSLVPSGNTNQFCNGYSIQSNTFTNNFGCSIVGGGAIRFECIRSDQTATSNNDRYTFSTIAASA